MNASVISVTWTICILLTSLPSLAAQANSFESVFRHGTEAMREGKLDLAADDFSQAIKLNPSFAEAYFNLGLVKVQQAHYGDAVEFLSRSVALKPRLRGANLFLGIALYREDQYSKAVTALKRETEIDPLNAQAFMWLGIAQLASGDALSASTSLDKAAQLKPGDVDILYHRGRAHMLVSKDSYEQMYKLAPDSWRVHQVLAQSFAEADRLDDAIAEAQLAIK